jgi:hypothetical protein
MPTELVIDGNANVGPRWEQGSEFHQMRFPGEVKPRTLPWHSNGSYWGSGRDAMRAILAYGRSHNNWRRLWIPSYFCHEVVESLRGSLPETLFYKSWSPGIDPQELSVDMFEPGDVVLLVNHFGLCSNVLSGDPSSRSWILMEDHTHDPWSSWAYSSNADYCVASLRKSIPIPDGGVLWSPLNRELPPSAACSQAHHESAALKLRAMELKASYLEGTYDAKEEYRRLLDTANGTLVADELSGIFPWSKCQIEDFPSDSCRSSKNCNFDILCQGLRNLSWVTVLLRNPDRGFVPFSAILIFASSSLRDRIKSELIKRNIYPAVLWPMDMLASEPFFQHEVESSRRMLSIHIDMRYAGKDILRVAEAIREVGATPAEATE